MIYIAPSLLSADMADFNSEINSVAEFADYAHCDVMDGHFVPNLTFGAPVVRAMKRVSRIPLDVHLMIENPDKWVAEYIDAGLDESDFLTFHIEAADNPMNIVNEIIDAGIKPGIAIKPGTDVTSCTDYLYKLSQVLVMTVEPGFGGQSFKSEMLPKIDYLRRHGDDNLVIGVDGGIDVETAPHAAKAGANLLVAGSAIFGKDDPVQAITDIRNACGLNQLPT